jgi:hypothetical protein
MKKFIALLFAWAVGWTVYMIAVVLTVYDGLLSLIFQPFIAMLVSALFVALAWLIEFVLKIPLVGKFWGSGYIAPSLVIVGSLFILCFGPFLGLTVRLTNPETGSQINGLHPVALVGGYFLLLFSIVNWPLKKVNTDFRK